MGVGVTSAVLASIVAFAVTIAMALRRPRRTIYTRFAAFTLVLFFWHAAFLAARFGDAGLRLQIGAALFIGPTAAAFFGEILREDIARTRRLARLTAVLSTAGLAVVFSPWGTHLLVRALATAYVVGIFGLALHALFARARSAAAETERQRTWYLLLGGLITLVLGLGALLPGAELLAALGHVAATFYVYFLYQSVLSRRVIDLVELLGKAAVLGVLTLMLATVYALLLLWVGTQEPAHWLFNTLVASFVILILYDQVRPWVEEFTARLFFGRRHELQRAVRHLLRELRTTISAEQMTERIVDALGRSGHTAHVAVYLPSEEEDEFELQTSRGVEPPRTLAIRQQPSLLQELRRARLPILLEALVDRYEDHPALTDGDASVRREIDRIGEAIATMRALGAEILLPMLADNRIVGLLSIGTEPAGDALSTEEIASLMSVAEAGAVIIVKSREYERMRERDRLVVVGEMAAGMAHEIRNPLGAIKGAAQCLEPERLPPETRELANVIIEESDRLSRVLGEFLEYARPNHANPTATDVNAVVTGTLRLLTAADSIPERVCITPSLAPDLPDVMVDPEHLKQVLINLVLNAAEAMMPAGGEVRVTTAVENDRESRGPEPGHLAIRVRDNGPGIPADQLSRVFVPFFTTKDKGTGLGLAISDRIVRNAGGRIEAASHPGHGATFTVQLPLA
jgi:signal transduction histidine kinase